MRSPRLCGTLRLTCRRCLPRLLTNEVALTPAASPPGESSLHDCTSFDLQGRRCQLAWSPATPPTRPPLALRRSPRQRTSRPVSAAYASQTALIATRCVQRGHHGPHLGVDILVRASIAGWYGPGQEGPADDLLSSRSRVRVALGAPTPTARQARCHRHGCRERELRKPGFHLGNRVVREGCLAVRAKEDIGQVVSVAWVRGPDCDFHRANVPPSTSAGNAAGS